MENATTPSREMENRASDFLNLMNDDTVERLHSKERQSQETQIYWESENLQLERQERMGIKETFDIAPVTLTKKEKKAGVHYPDGRVKSERFGNVRTGRSHRVVDVKRTVWQGGAKVRTFKSVCDSNVSLLRSVVNEQNQVACPNCGAFGTVDSFLDGCDYCGSKFEVHDFEAKVSGFSLIECLDLKLSKLADDIKNAYVAMFLIIWCIGFFGPLIMVFLSEVCGIPITYGILESSTAWIGKVFTTLVKGFFIAFASIIGFNAFREKQVTYSNVAMVVCAIPEFSEVEFMEEIDHRLRSVIFAEKPEQVMAYADLDLTAFAEAHKDVFDLEISKLIFRDAKYHEKENTDVITADVVVKVYRMQGKMVREEYEKITLTVSRLRQASQQNLTIIREYKCPNCGSSINIFHGCTCLSCGTVLDKHSLGWVLQDCSYVKQMNYYRTLPVLFLAAAALFLIL